MDLNVETSQNESEKRQREHYDRIIEDYQAHYDDEWSRKYRSEFIDRPLFEGLDLRGKRVLEAMCGVGQSTKFLLEGGAEVTGLDISPEAVTKFRARWPRANAVCGSILSSPFPDEYFDAVVVMGGLHHVHPHVNQAIAELIRVLKPGGAFCFIDPHSGSIVDGMRSIWYKLDGLFEKNEASIDVDRLLQTHRSSLVPRRVVYTGTIAYLLVYNSLIFRIPLAWKRIYSRPLMLIEKLLAPLAGKFLSCFVVARLEKKQGPSGGAQGARQARPEQVWS